jgi:hypothetical protein
MRLRAVVATLILVLSSSAGIAQERNTFIGDLVLKDVDTANGINFELMQPFGYIDSNGLLWEAQKGLVTDCASIPPDLWGVVGAPCTGLYRRASIIHDFYCEFRYRTWESVHDVFYDAMIASGVPHLRAKVMYYAVWRFGPRWDNEVRLVCDQRHWCMPMVRMRTKVPVIDDVLAERYRDDIRKFEARVKSRDLSLAEIREIADEAPFVERYFNGQ